MNFGDEHKNEVVWLKNVLSTNLNKKMLDLFFLFDPFTSY